ARKIIRAWYRMLFAGRLRYSDLHPGNYLFMEDGRIGVIDFGFVLSVDEDLWSWLRKTDRALTTGDRDLRRTAVQEWCFITNDPTDADYLRLCEAFADWQWRARYCGGPFDFADEADFREGINIFSEMLSKRYSRGRPCTPVISRQQF